MGDQASVTAGQAEPKQSREEKKLENKFKSLEADCGEYRKKHNGEAPAFCEAVEEGRAKVGRTHAMRDASNAGAALYELYNSPNPDPKRVQELQEAQVKALQRAAATHSNDEAKKK